MLLKIILQGNVFSYIILYAEYVKNKEKIMDKYTCMVCGYVFDPAEHDNTPFEELPEEWICPLCGVGKEQFTKQ